jgi:hypothetical protein
VLWGSVMTAISRSWDMGASAGVDRRVRQSTSEVSTLGFSRLPRVVWKSTSHGGNNTPIRRVALFRPSSYLLDRSLTALHVPCRDMIQGKR